MELNSSVFSYCEVVKRCVGSSFETDGHMDRLVLFAPLLNESLGGETNAVTLLSRGPSRRTGYHGQASSKFTVLSVLPLEIVTSITHSTTTCASSDRLMHESLLEDNLRKCNVLMWKEVTRQRALCMQACCRERSSKGDDHTRHDCRGEQGTC